MNFYFFSNIVWIWLAIALIVFIVLLFIPAPYGRFTSKKWGIMIPDRLGWFFMELPSLLVFSYFFFSGVSVKNPAIIFLAGLWILHYFHRSIIFPFQLRTKRKKMPLAITSMAVFFNLVNGYLNGYYLGNFSEPSVQYHYGDLSFMAGMLLFFTGLIINLQSDLILINLRKNSDNGYAIPYGGLFRWISCPNYFGELVEWAGFSIMAWNLPALSFFMWTFANLVPRALNYQRWYKKTFSDYPEERKALIPFIL